MSVKRDGGRQRERQKQRLYPGVNCHGEYVGVSVTVLSLSACVGEKDINSASFHGL